MLIMGCILCIQVDGSITGGGGGGGWGRLSANENFRHSLKVTNIRFSVSRPLSKT